MNPGAIPRWPTTPRRGKAARAAGGHGRRWEAEGRRGQVAFTFRWVPRRASAGLAAAHHAAVFNFSMGGQGDNAAQSHLTCW